MTSSLRIVLGSSVLAGYPQGGGVWACFYQHLAGLHRLGHDVFWLEMLRSTGDPARDRHNADIVWNFACGLTEHLLALFRRRALIDVDPGMVQIAALTWDMGIQHHEVLFTVGAKMHASDCEVPTLGRTWHTFLPCVDLSLWQAAPDPGANAPFSSITQWNWGEYEYAGRSLSISKRAAYLQYLQLPQRAGRIFELAANIDACDETGDRMLLLDNGWRLADPHRVADTVAAYARYIASSRAELSCAKPIYRELNTGWLSDRSACYLAAGRPVLAEDTGISDVLPTRRGFRTFRSFDEAVEGVLEIDADYAMHSRAAREFAEEFLDSRKCLERMVGLCF